MNSTTSGHLWKSWQLLRRRSRLITIVLFSIVFELAGNLIGNPYATANPVSAQLHTQVTPANSLSTPLNLSQLQNATYQIPILGQVTLVNGSYQSPTQPNLIVMMSKKYVIGNFDQDNTTDAVTVLRVTEQGQKSTFYLALIANQNGQPSNIDTISIGQGFGVKSLSLNGQQITVKLLKYAPNDAPCCPSAEISQSYWFNPTSSELIATSFSMQNPDPGGVPVRDVGIPINAQIGNNLPYSPSAVEIQF